MINERELQSVRDAFQSILRADYISISEIDQLTKLNNYYVDYLKNLPKVLQNQDSYINGRRGTGKTTLLMRAYYECLKTISPKIKDTSEILIDKKILPIYIDLSQCKDIFDANDSDSLERSFILKILSDLREQLHTIFEDDKLKILKEDYSKTDIFSELSAFIQEGMLIKTEKKNIQQETMINSTNEISAKLRITDMEVGASSSEGIIEKRTNEFEEVRNCNVQTLLSYLGKIRKKSKIDAIYVFVDEYSDLTEEEQNKFSILLKKLLGSKNNIFFKVGTITDRFDFGDQIIIGRDIYPISLDLNDFVERYSGTVEASKVLVKFTQDIIEKRLANFSSNISMNDLFKGDRKEIFTRISREAMGVPRTVGLILQNALIQAETKTDKQIQLGDINVGIKETRKIYFKQFQGAVQKKLIPGFYMDMWNALLGKALSEKNRYGDRPASHFMIDPIRKKYLNVFCENFIVHCLEESRASKYGGNYILYALDYDVCSENNILYAIEKDEFTAARFIYDSVFQQFDCYFMKDRLKSYRCPICKVIYEEAEVAHMKVKRCFECDERLEEIIHKDTPITEGNYTEVEVKILGLIATLDEEDAMSAMEIGDAVGCSYQKVALWCSRVLNRKELIELVKKNGKNYYYDKLD